MQDNAKQRTQVKQHQSHMQSHKYNTSKPKTENRSSPDGASRADDAMDADRV